MQKCQKKLILSTETFFSEDILLVKEGKRLKFVVSHLHLNGVPKNVCNISVGQISSETLQLEYR